MNKKTYFIIAGLFVLLILAFSTLNGSFIAQLRNTFSQFAAAVLGNSAGSNTVASASAAVLAANHLYELQEGDYAVVTQMKGPLTGIKVPFVASLPGGGLYQADVDKNTTVQIIPYKPGSHIAVSASDLYVEIRNQFDELTGYDTSGIANSVNARIKNRGTADVIVTMKLASKRYFDVNDSASARANKKAQLNAAKKAIEGAMGAGGRIKHDLHIINGLAITVNAKALKGLANNPNVLKVSPDLKDRIILDLSVDYIKAPDAWEQTDSGGKAITGQGTRIAIIDTGVDYTHADLGGCFGAGCKVEDGYDFYNNDSNPMDDNGHGTHVAATAAGIGMVGTTRLNGVAPGANILAYKVCTSGGSCPSSAIIAAINRAVDPNDDGNTADHADVISMSLGRYCGTYSPDCGPTDSLSTAVDNATAAGVVSAISAGNSGPSQSTVGRPAVAATAVAVAAGCAPHGDLSSTRCPVTSGVIAPMASFSSRGPAIYEGTDYKKPDITAPGVMICAARWGTAFSSTCFDSLHARISGTSMAAPHIAGVLALMTQAYPSETPAQLKTRIKAAATDLGGGMTYNDQGSGMVNVQKTIVDLSKVVSIPSNWTFSTNPAIKLSETSQSFSVSSKDPSVTTLTVGFTEPDPGITFTSNKSSLDVAGGVSASFTGTIQVDNDVVKSGQYTGVVTLKDSAGKVQGSISVPITVVSTIAVTPTGTLDYGFDNPGLTSWSSALLPVTIKNLRTDVSQTITAAPSSFVSGITYKVSPSPVTIPPAGSTIVNTSFTVTNSSVPNAIYTGSVIFSSPVGSVSIPTKFTKFYVLTIEDLVDPSNPLGYIELYDRTSFYTQVYYVGGKSLVLYFDDPTSFDAKIRFSYQSGFYDYLVLKEGVVVNGVSTLSVDHTQATHRVQLTGTDIDSKSTSYSTWLSFGSNFYFTEYDLKYVSDVSANYKVNIVANPYAMYSSVTSPFYIYGGSVQGIAADVSIANSVADLKKTVFPVSVNRPVGSSIQTGIYMCQGSLDGCNGFGSGYSTSTPYEHVVYSTSPFTYFYLVTDQNRGGCQSGGEKGTLSHQTVACANIFQSQVVNPVSGEHFTSLLSDSSLPGVAPNRVNVGLGPTAWFLKIYKVSSSLIGFDHPFATPKTPLMRQDYATQETASIPYTIYRDGTQVTTSTFAPWYVYSYSSTGPFAYASVPSAGLYNFQSTFPYQIQGVVFTGSVDSTFDTSRADPNPPFLKQLEYSTNGVRTDTYYSKASKSTLLLGMDPNGGLIKSVAVSYSLDGATFTLVPVTATTTAAGAGYVANIPSLTTTATLIALRLLATDASLNTLQYTFQLPISTATPPGAPTPTATLTTNKTFHSIEYASGVILTWSSTNATSCTSTEVPEISGISGTAKVWPTGIGIHSYSITCSGAGGTSLPATVTVEVTPAPIQSGIVTSLTTTSISGTSQITYYGILKKVDYTITDSSGTVVMEQGALSLTVQTDGTWQGTISPALPAGTYTVSIFAGNASSPMNTQTFTITSTSSMLPITHTLAVGWTGPEVSSLQTILKTLGFFSDTVTGYFGSITQKAVTQLQAANNVAAVGIVGPQTRSLLQKLLGQ
ncbi:MAG: S8 family serine peptidase [bacterium]|nr:S8 family serine peptidase [bacterium]